MREIVLDTETTGLDPAQGHRVVEIGCLELFNHLPSGKTFQRYVNPGRPMPEEAFAIHGLGDEFLADKPLFADIADAFLEFLGSSPLVIHNAEFDLRFLNWELDQLGHAPLEHERAVDTVRLTRQKFPGAPASLDALCRRFAISNSARSLHGALLDAQLLAEVYLELVGGRQSDLALSGAEKVEQVAQTETKRAPRAHNASASELAAHASFLEKLNAPIWNR